MNSSEPFGSHFINHLSPCAESCPIRIKSCGSLSRADKLVHLLSTEALGPARLPGGGRAGPCTCSAAEAQPQPSGTPNKQQPRQEASHHCQTATGGLTLSVLSTTFGLTILATSIPLIPPKMSLTQRQVPRDASTWLCPHKPVQFSPKNAELYT